MPRAAVLQGRHTKKKRGNLGNELIFSIPIFLLFGIKMMVISFPFSLHRYLLSTSKNIFTFLLKCSVKKGTFKFFGLFNVVSHNFQEGNEAQVTHCTTVTFAARSERVGGGPGGDSTHGGAAVRPVPWGSTCLKSGPALS